MFRQIFLVNHPDKPSIDIKK